jgi:hypothetical protein
METIFSTIVNHCKPPGLTSLNCSRGKDLFVAESAQLSEKLPRTAEEFLLFGNTNPEQTTQTTSPRDVV